jgi:hypothetical protein
VAHQANFEKKPIRTGHPKAQINVWAIIKNKIFEQSSEITGADYDD